MGDITARMSGLHLVGELEQEEEKEQEEAVGAPEEFYLRAAVWQLRQELQNVRSHLAALEAEEEPPHLLQARNMLQNMLTLQASGGTAATGDELDLGLAITLPGIVNDPLPPAIINNYSHLLQYQVNDLIDGMDRRLTLSQATVPPLDLRLTLARPRRLQAFSAQLRFKETFYLHLRLCACRLFMVCVS
ncbi:hypothetical protein GOP47_0025317 [Adiantum capillus-veneris]|uniref:Uncharacterized protein n=1 Tax=Adiantum capillus-veneris TaxID=13818 RepID=A0A9D4U133_ADICA|nr:hypothetical protein GOP47_0025317 [Adiantum capillus-veneris]